MGRTSPRSLGGSPASAVADRRLRPGGSPVAGDQREQLGRLGGALDSVHDAKMEWVLTLRNVASDEEQVWIKVARPVLSREDWKTAEPALRRTALEHRPRMGSAG